MIEKESKDLVEREMSNAMDKLKLIAEVRKRPAIWDFKSKEHKSIQKAWIDVAAAMGSDSIDECKSTWKNVRDAYRKRVKKLAAYIERDKLNGSYDPSNDYSSKWVLYEQMRFLDDINKQSPMNLRYSPINGKNSDDDDSNQFSKSHNMDNTKVEPGLDLERNNSLDERDISETYKLKLIAEIRKRRELWDIRSEEHRSCLSLEEVWKDLADSMESDVGTCQRTWVSLCKVYRRSVKRIELRIQEAKQKGSYNPNNDYSSEWTYFEHMKFIDNIKKPSSMKRQNSSVNDNNSDDNESNQFSKLHNMDNIEMEAELDKEREVYLPDDDLSGQSSTEIQELVAEKPTTSSRYSSDRLNLIAEVRKRPAIWDLQCKEHMSQTILKQTWKELGRAIGADADDCRRKWKILRQNYRDEVKKLKLRIAQDKSNGSYDPNNEYKRNWIFFEHMKFIDDTIKPRPLKRGNSSVNDNNSDDNSDQEAADDKPTTANWKYTKRSCDQANFLEATKKDEHKLIKSPRSDITDYNDVVHVTDSDYNFLVSFLPQMKEINVLQNLQFRTKITNLMLNFMSESAADDTVSVSSSQNVNSKNYS